MSDAQAASFRALLAGALLTCVSAACAQDTASETTVDCPDQGPKVEKLEYCRYFAVFQPEHQKSDPRVTARVSPDGRDTRSIAIVVGVSKYPNAAEKDLPAAANDVKYLKNFLVGDQKFDEVIVLQNEDVTRETLDYFLTTYLIGRSIEYDSRTRVLIAWSGHGTPDLGPIRSGLAFSSAKDDQDYPHLFLLSDLRAKVENLARTNFQVLVLLNSCFGGSLFGPGNRGGSADVSEKGGAYAITAGGTGDLVWSYGGDKGSVFFDRLIEGIRTAQADPKNVILVQDRYGKIVQRESIVRLGHLLTYLDDEVATENTKRDVNKQFALPWSGSMMPPPAISEGGFFFLSPIWTPSGLAADPVSVPTGSTSVIPGRPDLKVFKTDPTAYAIKGIDLSHYNGSVDWPTLATSGYSFAYLKATEGASFQDTSFKPNWGASGSTNIVRGAYHTFRFCSTVDAQIANFMSMNPVDTSTLPPAVDIEPAGAASYQTALDKPVGGCVVKNIEDERLALLDFLEKIQQKTGKVPVIFGASDVFRDLIDARFKKFNFWIAQYRATGGPDITLPGETPWTLWQHSSYAKVAGIQGDTDENVFFGNQADFQAFVAGRANPALAAVRSSN